MQMGMAVMNVRRVLDCDHARIQTHVSVCAAPQE